MGERDQRPLATNGWLAAGYRTRDVDIEGTTILFVKDDEPLVRPQRNPAHPVLGCMEGTVTVMPGVDLTEPAMPEWAETVANAKLYNE